VFAVVVVLVSAVDADVARVATEPADVFAAVRSRVHTGIAVSDTAGHPPQHSVLDTSVDGWRIVQLRKLVARVLLPFWYLAKLGPNYAFSVSPERPLLYLLRPQESQLGVVL